MITTYLFDLDDTLIDTRIYAKLYGPALERIKEKLEINQNELDQRAKDCGLTKNKFNRWDSGDLARELGLLDIYYEELEKILDVLPIADSVRKVLQTLKEKGKKIGIVSNSMHKTIQIYVKKYGLPVDFIFSKDDAGCKKNQDAYWRELIKQKDLVSEECLVVGDDQEEDINMPKKFGFHTFHLTNFNNLEEVCGNKISGVSSKS